MFVYHRKVNLYETDLMGVVHHSNYLKYLEEARTVWAFEAGMIDYQKPESVAYFTVYETRSKFVKPLRYADELNIQLQARRDKNRVIVQYRIYNQLGLAHLAETIHVPLNKDLKLVRWTESIIQTMEKQKWTETWL